MNPHFAAGCGRRPENLNTVLIRFEEVVENCAAEQADKFEFERRVVVVGSGRVDQPVEDDHDILVIAAGDTGAAVEVGCFDL